MISNRSSRSGWSWTRSLKWMLSGIGSLIVFGLMIVLPGYVGYGEIEGLRHQQEAHSRYNPAKNPEPIGGAAPSFAEAKSEQAAEEPATCDHPRYREDADLCAQWEAVEAVTRGNVIALAGLRSSIVAVLSGNVGILLTALGLVIATFAARDATRAVRAMENLERGYIDVAVRPGSSGSLELTLTNIGRSPIWLLAVDDAKRGRISGQDLDGVHCIPADKMYSVMVNPMQGANPGLLNIKVTFRDVLDQVRLAHISLKMSRERWLLHDVCEQRAK